MNKLRLIFTLFVIWVIIIILKLFYIQVIASGKYSANQYLKTIIVKPIRGQIYDRNKEPLVINQTAYLMYLEPKKVDIEKKEYYINKIDKILNIGKATVEAKLNKNKDWVIVDQSILEQTKDKIERLKLPGIGFEEKQIRYYPESSIAAQLLGFVGKTEEGSETGYFGIEGYYEKDLAGLPGLVKTERDLLGKPIIIGIQEKLKGENGRDLFLTIDKNIQFIAKKNLAQGIEKYGAKSGCVIIADPISGQILALSCLPDFDPSNYGNFTEDYFRNPTISDLFEPGSIMKPLIMAAALNEKKIKITDTYNETGPITIGKYQIKTWNDKYEGKIDMTRIIEKSSNVGMVYVGRKLGDKNIVKYLNLYGLGQKTNIDLQGEVSGYLKEFDDWYKIDFATATFGQGITVTPIQMISAFSSLINGGYLVEPYVGLKFISENNDVKKVKPVIVKKILTTKTSNTIKKVMQKAVQYQEAHWDVPEGYEIGGKTGTAQVPVEGDYDPSKTIASFIGFAPVDKPKFLILVTLKEPTASPWGSETAAPIFFKITNELLVYYNIMPN